MGRNLFWLSDEQWERIEPHLPTDVRGVERADNRRIISGIVHVLKSGCRWCDCPPEYGPPTTIYNRFVRWARRDIWENLFRELAGHGRSTDTQMIDSTHVKAHRSAAGGKGGSRSRLLAARAEALRPCRLSPGDRKSARGAALRRCGTPHQFDDAGGEFVDRVPCRIFDTRVRVGRSPCQQHDEADNPAIAPAIALIVEAPRKRHG